MKKNFLRTKYKNKRLELNEEVIKTSSEEILLKLTDFILSNEFQHVHVFLSSQRHKEIATKDFIEVMWQNGVNVYTSISNMQESSLTHFRIFPETKSCINKWGIPEPIDAEQVDEKTFDVVVTPLLIFDQNGYRVGYGKGFYDRFFALCQPEVVKIGVSLFEPVEHIEDIDEFDFPLDFCITPDQFYAF
jgi:5-formyltetrahydrofolate cyclo-ligase